MKAPRYIQEELKLINPQYFAVHDPSPRLYSVEEGFLTVDTRGRWLIRKWKYTHPYSQKLDTWRFNSTPIMTLCQESATGQDIGYEPLDMRAVHSVRQGLYNARHAKELLLSIDKSNDDLVAKAEAEEEYIFRYAAKQIYKHFREPTVFLGE